MDKRIIMIIVILILGIGCMYFIVDNSNTVGNAITTFSKTTITLPPGFSVGETHTESAELYNKQSNEKINIYDHGKGDSTKETFKNLTTYKKNPKYHDINETTENIKNITVLQVNMQENNTISSSSVFYYFDHTYSVEMTGFNEMTKVNENLEFIINTLQPDYKQSQD